MSTYKIHNRQVNHEKCPIVEASKFIADFWNIWILRTLLEGPKRFSQIKSEIPSINKVTLVNKLKVLITAQLVEKIINDSLKVQYQLTESGEKIRPLISELEKFGRETF